MRQLTENDLFGTAIDFVILTARDPWGNIAGGKCRFVQHLLSAFGSRVAVVFNSYDSNLPEGQWLWQSWSGQQIACFNLGRIRLTPRLPLVPLRLLTWVRYKIHLKAIRRLDCRKVFIDSPEALGPISAYSWENVCYCLGGVNNPFANSRYRWGRRLGGVLARRFFRQLNDATDVVLASADNAAIAGMRQLGGDILRDKEIIHFPTRVDCTFFSKREQHDLDKKIGTIHGFPMLLACGRIAAIKGWPLLLDSLACLVRLRPEAKLIWVGDGEERQKLESYAKQLGLENHLVVTGMVNAEAIRDYLSIASVGVIGSYMEGWSLAMLEMLSCGLPIVSTEVSGANDLIDSGKNGYIVRERDPELFCERILDSLELYGASDCSRAIARQYDICDLRNALQRYWPTIADGQYSE
jgi:glycosyltransferase involved in cell wall biosynthesis